MFQVKPVLVEISPGELFDKITVLQVKTERIGDEQKLANIHEELQTLEQARDGAIDRSAQLDGLVDDLRSVNRELYDVIAGIYDCKREHELGERFHALALDVYRLNDRRALLKRKINLLLGSRLVEEKGHAIEQ